VPPSSLLVRRETQLQKSLQEARSTQLSADKRAADYLQAAALTARELGSGREQTRHATSTMPLQPSSRFCYDLPMADASGTIR
jgi:hypothetical protein